MDTKNFFFSQKSETFGQIMEIVVIEMFVL